MPVARSSRDKGKARALEVFLAGGGALLLAWAALNGYGLWVLIYPALLLWALVRLPGRWRPFSAALWGVLFAGLFYRWVLGYGVIPWAALCLVRGLPWALFPLPGLLLERWGRRGVGPVAVGGGLALTAGALLLGPTGVDWETPAGALVGLPSFLVLLPWLGLVGYAGVLGVLSGVVFWSPYRVRLPLFATLGLAAGISLSWGAGPSSGSVAPLRVALVQPGWAQDDKWDEAQREASVERLFELTERAAAQGAELVVWPETSWPYFDLRRSPRDSRRVGRLARNLGVWILAGSIERVPEPEGGADQPSEAGEALSNGWRNAISSLPPPLFTILDLAAR